MNRLFAVIALATCLNGASSGACNVVRQGIVYDVEFGTVAKVRGPCDTNSTMWLQEGGRLEIPPFVGGLEVKSIESRAFEGIKTIRSVVLPETVAFVGSFAFNTCTNIESIVMKEYDDDYLRKHSVRKCISSYAFASNGNLKSVVLPKTLEELNSGVFFDCAALRDVRLPWGLWQIYDWAFASCHSIHRIEIPPTVEVMDDAFGYDTPNLAEIVVDNDNPWYRSEGPAVYSLTNRAVALYPKTTPALVFYSRVFTNDVVRVKPGTRAIQNYAFMCCKGIGRVELPDSVEKIGEMSFARSSLRSITLPESLKAIGKCAFAECVQLKSISIPRGVSAIGERCFWGCDLLAEIEFQHAPPPPTSMDEQFPSNAVFKVYGFAEEWKRYGRETGRTIKVPSGECDGNDAGRFESLNFE